MLVTDPGVAALGHPERIMKLLEAEGIEVVLYGRARVEPTIESFQHAADFAIEHEVDGFVSVGGGSSMDTAKVANLVSTHRSARARSRRRRSSPIWRSRRPRVPDRRPPRSRCWTSPR